MTNLTKGHARRWVAIISLVLLWLGPLWPASAATPSEADVALASSSEERLPHQLDVTLVVFNPGIPANSSTHRQLGIFPKVRQVEARFLPFVLRDILESVDEWGAVRVAPESVAGSEMLVTGQITQSNGEILAVQLRAVDALGQVWVDGLYSVAAMAPEAGSPGGLSASLHTLFRSFADDLLTARQSREFSSLTAIREVALLRYAENLLPENYQGYLRHLEDGGLAVARLPARNDPMLDRIRRVRQFEYLFTDKLDEQYASLYSEIAPTYNLWLRYQERLTRYRMDGETRRRNNESRDKRGSYAAIRKSYEDYKWVKMEEQNLRQWAAGFDNEVAPTVVELDGRVVQLNGSLEQRYVEWRELLSSMFALETGEALR